MNWPFEDPENVLAFTVRQVLLQRLPILWVSHDADDGAWQFMPGSHVELADAMVVALRTVLDHDPSIAELADLPLGWTAERVDVGQPWSRRRGSEIDS